MYAIRSYYDLAQRFPGTKAAYNYAYVNWVADPMEALNVLGQLDPDFGAVRGYLNYWWRRGEALHTLGEFENELTSARESYNFV